MQVNNEGARMLTRAVERREAKRAKLRREGRQDASRREVSRKRREVGTLVKCLA